jgi:ferredoxin-thioredoxin reductase catalytic subunit
MKCDCGKLNLDTQNHEDRVYVIAEAAPDCACESQLVSLHSPHPVRAEETLGRMVCTPMHVHSKRKELKPSFFEHAFSYGLSVQRLELAAHEELARLVVGFLEPKEDRTWLGYVECSCEHLRNLRDESSGMRMFCVYDSGEENNPAHTEIGVSRRIPEADQNEYRRELMRVFGEGVIQNREKLHDGSVLALMPQELQSRPRPKQWLE